MVRRVVRDTARGAVVLLAIVIASVAPATAQSLHVERLTQDDGLSQNFARVFAQDSFGFVWVGTQDGLNRLDGYEIRTFRPDGSGSALRDAFVRSVAPSRDGGVWVGTREGGVARWNPRTESFTSWMHDPDDPASLAYDYVTSVLETPDGSLWAGTLEGLSRLDPRTGRFTTWRHDPADAASLAHDEVAGLFADAAGTLWISFRNGALDTFQGNAFVHHQQALEAAGVTGLVTSFANADGRRVWIGTASGLFAFDPATRSFARVDTGTTAGVTALLAARDGTLWVGTRGGGLLRRDAASGGFHAARHDPSDPHSIPADEIEGLFEDRTGVIWIGSAQGLARHDPASAAFRVYRAALPGAAGLAGSYVWSVDADRAGNLWIGTDEGLSRLDRATGGWTNWTASEPPVPGGLLNETVTALLVDRGGAVWAGGPRGLSRLDPATGRFESWRKEDGGDFALPNNRIFDLFETRDGTILVGMSRGIARWDPARRGFERLREEEFSVFTMTEDGDGSVLLGTFNNGLYRLDLRTRELTRFTDASGRPFDRPRQIASSLADSRGRLWIGTTQGLFRIDPRDRVLRQFRMKDGLPNEAILGIVEDRAGAIWISTNAGLVRHDPQRGGFRTYTRNDGLPSDEFNQMAAGRTAGGELLFGTPAGFVAFRPEDVRGDAQAPAVAITGMELFNAPVPIGGRGRFSLAESILTTRSLSLSHREKVVTFTFAALHFAAPEEARFSYRLEGWDDAWRDATPRRRSATYTNLPAGNYTFRVRASNKDGVWSEPGAAVAIHVAPPPWKTWWAYATYLALLALAIGTFVRARVRSLRARQRELEALVRQRTAELEVSEKRAMEASHAKSVFLANMSHELRTPLNAVLGFAQLLERSPMARGDEAKSLEIIRRAGEHLLGLINDVLSLSKIEAGRLTLDARPFAPAGLVATVESMMRERAERAGLSFSVERDGALPAAVEGDEGKLRQVLVNLVGNAVKFTARGGVVLRVAWREGRARFEVEDTGPGMTAAEVEHLFEAFVQTESGRQAKEGTGLGLAITREIVRMMDGDIQVESAPGRGSRFWFDVALPASGAAVDAGQAAARVTGLAAGAAPKRILVADDVAENRLLIVRLLGSVGLEVLEAADGEEALRLWESERPDLVLMDMRMPRLDGREATRRLRAIESGRGLPRTPVAALTASAFEHERDEILRDGADDFLTKPFREGQLFDLVARQTGVTWEYGGAAASRPARGFAADDVARMSGDEARRLHDALDSGALERAAGVALEIRRRDAKLGDDLLAEIRAVRVDRLLELLESHPAGGNA